MSSSSSESPKALFTDICRMMLASSGVSSDAQSQNTKHPKANQKLIECGFSEPWTFEFLYGSQRCLRAATCQRMKCANDRLVPSNFARLPPTWIPFGPLLQFPGEVKVLVPKPFVIESKAFHPYCHYTSLDFSRLDYIEKSNQNCHEKPQRTGQNHRDLQFATIVTMLVDVTRPWPL